MLATRLIHARKMPKLVLKKLACCICGGVVSSKRQVPVNLASYHEANLCICV